MELSERQQQVAAEITNTTATTTTTGPPEATLHDNNDDDNGNMNSETMASDWSLGLAFWLLGLFNNSSYVIMIASAKTISEGGTALVFLANIFPSMMVKLTAPYWFDYVSYEKRILAAFTLMVLSFGLVASLSSHSSTSVEIMTTITTTVTNGTATIMENDNANTTTGLSMKTMLQLVGVAMGSAQCGMGEASLLGAAGKCDTTGKGVFVTCFASGTGLAGVFGFLWKFTLNEFLGYSMATTLSMAQIIAVLYLGIFWKCLHPHLQQQALASRGYETVAAVEIEQPLPEDPMELTTSTYHDQVPTTTTTNNSTSADHNTSDIVPEEFMDENDHVDAIMTANNNNNHKQPIHEMTFLERTQFIGTALWPYIIPLFVVYATEYSLQAGTWTAIGFPVESQKARDDFYEFSNWMYQAGVFVSRSSGALGTAPMSLLWLMPTLQAVNVVFFAYVAAYHFWYTYSLLMPVCFFVGLLGGGMYFLCLHILM